MTKLMKYALVACSLFTVIIPACKKDKDKSLPSVTTNAPSDITPISAKVGGNITGNGGSEITGAGVVYSKTNQTPTISDSKVQTDVKSGSFTIDLTGIEGGSTYYVRAYATSSVGTGYGDVKTITTGNAAPTAANINIDGEIKVNRVLTAGYDYSDSENDPEGETNFQWYVADDATGTNETAVTDSTAATYTLQPVDEFKYVRVGIKAKATAGTLEGVEVKSAYSGPVAEAIDVTFEYNNQIVTYGIITSSVTGKQWLDRNLGAPNAPSAYDDFTNFGDLFQWGREDDGHQVLVRNGTTNALTVASATTTTLATTDNPGNNLFILSPTFEPYDWRDPSNLNLWQGVNGINNPCPEGWRLPTLQDWIAENITDVEAGYSQLKLTLGGNRSGETGRVGSVTFSGVYWTSEPSTDNDMYVRVMTYGVGVKTDEARIRANGESCRCIKD